MARVPGDKVGRAIIDRRLGAGGMAEAYLAHTEGLGGFHKRLVVKVLHPFHALDPRVVALFLREARVGAGLNHTNIVQIFDVGADASEHWIAMEYVEGLTLLQAARRCWAQGDGVPVEVVLRVIIGVAHGLHHAHTFRMPDGTPAGIVHRDMSPDNIMIALDGTPKILDFGVAKISGPDATRAGEVKGKVPYMSPEQVTAGDVDHRSDLWSLGVTLYYCLAGKRPFGGDTDLATMKKIVSDDPPSLRALNPTVSPELEAVVMACLKRDRSERIPSAAELAERLSELVPPARRDPVVAFVAGLRALEDNLQRATGGHPAVKLPPEDDDLPSASAVELRPATDVDETTVSTTPTSPAMDSGFQSVARTDDEGPLAARSSDVLPLPTADADITHEDMSALRVPPAMQTDASLPSSSRWVLAALAGTGAIVVALAIGIAVVGSGPPPVVAIDKPQIRAVDGGTAAGPIGMGDAGVQAPDEVGEVEPQLPAMSDPRARGGPAPSVKTSPVTVDGPAWVRWITLAGKVLGSGAQTIAVPDSEKLLLAWDTRRDVKTVVPVAPALRYDALPKGRLVIQVTPFATDVRIGAERVGPTPVTPMNVPSGTYKITATRDKTVVTKSARVRAGEETVVVIDVRGEMAR